MSTNWYVITGGPSSGKTTTVNLLCQRGYKTTIENARHYIDTKRVAGETVEHIRQNQLAFQRAVLDIQIDLEASLKPDDLVFLDRAVPDALAYYRYLDLPIDQKLTAAIAATDYRGVFILAPLPLVNDYARTEDVVAQQALHRGIVEVYQALPFPIIHVPPAPPSERVELVLRQVPETLRILDAASSATVTSNSK